MASRPGPRRWRSRSLAAIALAAASLLLAGTPASLAADDASLARVKAKFLFQLLKYVKWPAPEEASEAVVIGVVGDATFAAVVTEVVAGRTARGHTVEVVNLEGPDDAAVHVLFLPTLGRSETRRVARDYQTSAVLTVADRFDFPELGGDVGIEMVGGRVSFSINRRKAERGDFKISSKLLRLASEVL
jgi:hypothetical protein